jgi:hypothetical protein
MKRQQHEPQKQVNEKPLPHRVDNGYADYLADVIEYGFHFLVIC